MTTMPDWLPGIRILAWARDGGAQVDGYPWRLVLHTTEGGESQTTDSAQAGYSARGIWPHFTADIRNGKTWDIVQHGPLSRGATVMDNDAGGAAQTNRAHCIAIELIGQADRARELFSNEGFRWLGTKLAPIFGPGLVQFHGPPPHRPFVDATDGWVAREDAFQRFTIEEWNTYDGVCGHCHGPEDEHYDPGKVDIFLPSFFAGAGQTQVEEGDIVVAMSKEEFEALLNTTIDKRIDDLEKRLPGMMDQAEQRARVKLALSFEKTNQRDALIEAAKLGSERAASQP